MSLRLKRIDYFVFFFKQKTAYEMRISDWSSDVCSSDLSQQAPVPGLERVIVYFEGQVVIRETLQEGLEVIFGEARSEEHTSELQSLMRISYAVFCLKKKKTPPI